MTTDFNGYTNHFVLTFQKQRNEKFISTATGGDFFEITKSVEQILQQGVL